MEPLHPSNYISLSFEQSSFISSKKNYPRIRNAEIRSEFSSTREEYIFLYFSWYFREVVAIRVYLCSHRTISTFEILSLSEYITIICGEKYTIYERERERERINHIRERDNTNVRLPPCVSTCHFLDFIQPNPSTIFRSNGNGGINAIEFIPPDSGRERPKFNAGRSNGTMNNQWDAVY